MATKNIKTLLLTILLAGMANILAAQTPDMQGTWVLKNAQEKQWADSKMVEKELNIKQRTGSTIPYTKRAVYFYEQL